MRLVLATALILTFAPVALHGQVEQINARPSPDSAFTSIPPASARPDNRHYSLRENPSTRSLGWQQITKAEPSSGGHRHVGLGLGLGFVVGTLAGIAIESGAKDRETRGLNELRGAIGGAFFGTIIGGTVGFFWRTGK